MSTVHIRSIIPRVGPTSDRRTFPCSIINYSTCLLDFAPGWQTPTKSHKNTEKLERDGDTEREREREIGIEIGSARETDTERKKYSQKRKSWRERESERGEKGGKKKQGMLMEEERELACRDLSTKAGAASMTIIICFGEKKRRLLGLMMNEGSGRTAEWRRSSS